MRTGWLKLGLVTMLWGSLSFADICYTDYEQGFRSSVGQAQPNPQEIINRYHECLALEKTKQQRQAATQEFRSQTGGHGHSGGHQPSDDSAQNSPARVQGIPKTASRGVWSEVEPLAPQSADLIHEKKVSTKLDAVDPCTGAMNTYLNVRGERTCNQVSNNALVAVNDYNANREKQMLGYFGELSRTNRR